MPIEVETRNVSGQVTAIGAADSFTLVVDRPIDAGGGGRGFNGGQLLFLAGHATAPKGHQRWIKYPMMLACP